MSRPTERRIRSDGTTAEVRVFAPAAMPDPKRDPLSALMTGSNGTWEPPSPSEVMEAQAQLIRELQTEVEKQKIASGTLGNALTQVCRLLNDERGAPRDAPIEVERYWIERLAGATVTLSETDDRDLVIRFRERIENPGWEGA